jgi:hypothetical protein
MFKKKKLRIKVAQGLLRLEQRIRGRTGEVSHEIHTNQSSPSWDLNEICTLYEIPDVSYMVVQVGEITM